MSTHKNSTLTFQAAVARLAVAASAVVVAAPSPAQTAATAPAKAAKPAPAPAARPVGLSCAGTVASPGRVSVPIGKSTLLQLPEAVNHRTLGNPQVAQAMMVSPDTLYLLGVEIGATNMIVQGRSGRCSAIDVIVTMDPAGLQATYKELMPEETGIRVTAAADSLILSGTASDSTAVIRAVDLANAFVRRPATSPNMAAYPEGTQAAPGAPAATGTTGTTGTAGTQQQTRVVNLLQVAGAQQVMLEVKIAEVSKTLLDKLGVGVGGVPTSGSWMLNMASNFTTGALAPGNNGLLGGALSLSRGSNIFKIEAEKKDGLVKILAEPTVMAISGQEGSFLAGGKILIPVAQQAAGLGGIQVTLEEKEFGVGLKFTPTVLAGGRINLRVAPEVSELSKEGVGVSLANNNTPSILPLITTRRASTTVQLVDGQSFAIGGLIKNNTTSNIKAFPVLGELPIIGALFRSTDFQNDRTELLFVVTPHLVKPLPADYKLPTDGYKDPSRSELFLGGKLEGEPDKPAKGGNGGGSGDGGKDGAGAPKEGAFNQPQGKLPPSSMATQPADGFGGFQLK